MAAGYMASGLGRDDRRRFRELLRRRGRNVNHDARARAAWERCRELCLAYLDTVIAVHASGCEGSVPGWGRYRNLNPDEQVARRDVDHDEWVRLMEDTPWFPGRTLGHPRLEALEGEIYAAWETYALAARNSDEPVNGAGFDVERALLYRAGAKAVGANDYDDEIAAFEEGGRDLSGLQVEVLLPAEAERVLGADWIRNHGLPEIALETRLIPDWEFPGYWLIKDNRAVSGPDLADLLAHHPQVSELQRRMLRGEVPLSAPGPGEGAGSP